MENEINQVTEEQKIDIQKQNIENIVQQSKSSHQQRSYYHSDKHLDDYDKKLIQQEELLSTNDQIPKMLISEQKDSKIECKNININNFSFLDDDQICKVIIKFDDYKELIGLQENQVRCEFTDESFKFEAIPSHNSKNIYTLPLDRTRNKIVKEKCKCYIKNNKIFIALYKEKKESWYTLRGYQ